MVTTLHRQLHAHLRLDLAAACVCSACVCFANRYPWPLLQPVILQLLQEQIGKYEAEEHVEVRAQYLLPLMLDTCNEFVWTLLEPVSNYRIVLCLSAHRALFVLPCSQLTPLPCPNLLLTHFTRYQIGPARPLLGDTEDSVPALVLTAFSNPVLAPASLLIPLLMLFCTLTDRSSQAYARRQ